MGCMLFVNMRKKREVLLLGCLSVEAGVFLVFVCCCFFLPSPESFLLQLDHRAIKRII